QPVQPEAGGKGQHPGNRWTDNGIGRVGTLGHGCASRGNLWAALLHIDDHHEPTAMHLGVVVRGVVRDMAMDQPFAALARLPDRVTALPRTNIHGVGMEARRRYGVWTQSFFRADSRLWP